MPVVGKFVAKAMAARERGWLSLIPIVCGQKFPSIKKWEMFGVTPPSTAQIAAWGEVSPNAGLGFVYGGQESVLAVDLDWLDGRAYTAWARTKDTLGPTPLVREGLHPKKLMLYRFEQPMVLPGKNFGNFELFYAVGTQTVFSGIHPDTHKPYHWIAGANPTQISPRDLPLVNQSQLVELIERLRPLCDDPNERSQSRKVRRTTRVYAPVGKGASDRASGAVASVISDLREHTDPMLRAIDIVRHSTPGNRYPNAFGCTVALVRMGYADSDIKLKLIPVYSNLFLPSERNQRIDAMTSALHWARNEIGDDAESLASTTQVQSIESWWQTRKYQQ